MKIRIPWLTVICVVFVLSSVPAEAATYVVDRVSDGNPSGQGQGANLVGDLRYAISNALSGDRITISVSGTIHLAASLPVLTRNVCIQGPGADLVTVEGPGESSVFAVGSGTTVTLSGVSITGGRGNGGGIFNQGTLTLSNGTVGGNTAGDPTNGGGTGAGIWNAVGATLTLNGSTVSDNSAIGNLSYAPSRGAGIANDGTATLNNSTVSGNSASQGFGGGISNSGALTLNDSTVSANSSQGTNGGGVDNRGTLTVRNTIIAGNADGDLSGDVTSEGYNLFGITNGGGFAGTDLVNVTPLLGPLQNNGGPTATMAPLPGSPAIDRTPGTPGVDFPPTDQRGLPRPQGARADCGGVEVAVSQTFQAFSAQGGEGSIEVFAPDSWTATSNDSSWVTITSASGGSGNGTLTFSVAAHSGSSPRNTTLTINDETFTVLQGGNFPDVPPSHPFYASIGKLSARGVTIACGGGNYCPDDPVSRDQIAAFQIGAPFDDHIETMAERPVLRKCSDNSRLDCGERPVTRAEIAALLVRALEAQAASPRLPVIRVDSANRPPTRSLGLRFTAAVCSP